MKIKTIVLGLIFLAVPFYASAAPHSTGVNTISNGTVFMITGDGQRRPYTSASAFLSYGFNSWGNVKQANADDLSLPIGDLIPPRDGKIICSDRGVDKGTCYLITNSKKAGFTSGDVFNQLGFNFKYALSGDISFLPTTDNISDATKAHPPGTLINDNGTIKLVGSGGNVTVGIPSMDTLKSWGYSLVDVVSANTADQALIQNDILGNHAPGTLIWYDGAPPASSPTPTPQPTPSPAPTPQGYSANTLYSTLSAQLAYITCNWHSALNGAILGSISSNGLLIRASNGSNRIITVLGGVTNSNYLGYNPSTCNIQFPAGTSLYAGGLSNFIVGSLNGTTPIAANMNVDYAQINIAIPNQYVTDYAKSINYCPTRPSIGDQIAVFGWPPNSTNQTLTGSITGLSGYYDTTNIQVPDGMQGSTAVSLTKGCVIGQINSSGQIVDNKGVAYVLGF